MKYSILQQRVIAGDVHEVRHILRNLSTTILDPLDDNPLLFKAIESDQANMDMLELLIEFGADVNTPSGPNSTTPLRYAIQNASLDKVRFLLECGANPFYPVAGVQTALFDSLSRHHDPERLVKLLIAHGANVNGYMQDGKALIAAVSNSGRFEGVRILLREGAYPEPLMWNSLMESIGLDDIVLFQLELRRGAGLEARDSYYRTPFLLACHAGSVKCATLLHDLGVDIHAKSAQGENGVALAISRDHVKMLKWLVSRNIDVNDVNNIGMTALQVANEAHANQCLEFLLRTGVQQLRSEFPEPVTLNKNNSYEDKAESCSKNIADIATQTGMHPLFYAILAFIIATILFTAIASYFYWGDSFSDADIISSTKTKPSLPQSDKTTLENKKLEATETPSISNDATDLSDINAIITFDDGPHPSTTPYLIDMLKKSNVHDAIFFLVGYRIIEYPELVRSIKAAGYEIGYHSMAHDNMATWSESDIGADIERFKIALHAALGEDYKLRIGRPPFGGMSRNGLIRFRELEKDGRLARTRNDQLLNIVDNDIREAFTKHGLDILLWNIDFDDWEQQIDSSIVQKYFSYKSHQTWLFHERPVNWVTLRAFDNHLVDHFPDILIALDTAYRSSITVERIQEELKKLGYYSGVVDGLSGQNTYEAIEKFEADHPSPPIEPQDFEKMLAKLVDIQQRTANADDTSEK